MTKSSGKGLGSLYIVATPIGNLDDLTARAKSVLGQVDRVCCEDTRHSVRLFERIGISAKLESLHEHNEREKSSKIVSWLEAGESIALISDAGTPLISDPGYVLVNEAVAAGAHVVPVPGASALIAALSVGGLPTDRFAFEGFLPSKGSARRSAMEATLGFQGTVVFYESSHRIVSSLKDMAAVYGPDRRVVLARELTKAFETVLRGTVSEVLLLVESDSNQRKGEFVVLVGAGEPKPNAGMPEEAQRLMLSLKAQLPPKVLAASLADAFGGRKKDYYDALLAERDAG